MDELNRLGFLDLLQAMSSRRGYMEKVFMSSWKSRDVRKRKREICGGRWWGFFCFDGKRDYERVR